MKIQPEISDLSLVLIGNFNPSIFQPEWFGKYDILSEKDIEECKINVIHSEVAEFQNDWLKVQVLNNRFYAGTTELPFVRVCDFVVSTFKDHLPHTPLKSLGINYRVHFSAGSIEARDKVGEKLAPREPWGEWGGMIDAGEGEEHGGMKSLTMQIRKLDDREKGSINIKVEPSTLLPIGIFVEINDHYELKGDKESLGSDGIIKLLIDKFESSKDRSSQIINQVMELV